MPVITTLSVPPAEGMGEYASSEGESSTTSATYQNKTTLTFTAESGDYLIFWYFEQYVTSPAGDGEYRLYNNTDLVEYGYHRNDANKTVYDMRTGMIKVTLTAGSKTLYLQWRTAGGTAYIRRARIFARKC